MTVLGNRGDKPAFHALFASRPGPVVPLTLLLVFIVVWLALAIAPRYRQDWLLENLAVVVAIPLLVWSYRRLRLSNLSYGALFLFLLLHEVGAHYTYSEVPYEQWAQSLFGFSPQHASAPSRNHYDRLLHFLYGLLVTPAAVDLLAVRARPVGMWRWILPVTFVMSHSVVYELVEWFAALTFGGDLGAAYLGTQGDPWDAQQDMLLAMLGSVVAIAALALCVRRAA